MTSSPEWDAAIRAAVDRITAAAGKDGTSRKAMEPLVLAEIKKLIGSKKLSRPEVDDDVSRSLDRLDQARRANADDFMHVVDALNDDTILGRNDPWLDCMAVVGTGDGLRKLNRWLTVADLDSMVRYRRKKMQDVSNAFHLFADAVDALKFSMVEMKADNIDGLFPDGGADGVSA